VLDLLIVAVATFVPTVALALVALVLWRAAAALTRRPFAWSQHVDAFLAAVRLQAAVLLLGVPVVGFLFGRWLYLGVAPLVAALAMVAGAIAHLVFASRGVPSWASWPIWRRTLSWPFRAD
jgi:hypothetical protein